MARRTATAATPHELATAIGGLVKQAMRFVPPGRCEAVLRSFIRPQDVAGVTESRRETMAADALMLAADLSLSQPSASGSTAFDRLVRQDPGATPGAQADRRALAAARFHLLRLEAPGVPHTASVRDVISGATLRLISHNLGPVPVGTALFGRIAMLGEDLCCAAGVLTPLDQAALAVAAGHAAAGATSSFAAARWAEAVYTHVVRRGTLEVPGLNRPGRKAAEDLFQDDTSEVLWLARQWAALAGQAPSEHLERRTRQQACPRAVLEAVRGAVLAAEAGDAALGNAAERMLLIFIETLQRREAIGSGNETLDDIARVIETGIGKHKLPLAAGTLFKTLRQRVKGAVARPGADGAALAAVLQRIQGLRAKTVDQGCTEAEAMAAAEKVAELLDRYGLSLGEIDFRAQACDGAAVQTNRRRFAAIDTCVPVVARFFDCRVWLEHAKGAPLRYVFFGLRADVAAAQYLLELVENAFATETDKFRAGELYAAAAGERRSASNSFQVGLADGICAKLAAIQAARSAHCRSLSGRDLVVMKTAIVDQEVAKLGMDLHERQVGGSKYVLSDAYAAGEEAGQRFEYSPGISLAA